MGTLQRAQHQKQHGTMAIYVGAMVFFEACTQYALVLFKNIYAHMIFKKALKKCA